MAHQVKKPSDFLKSVLGQQVAVKLNSGEEYRGKLACLDNFLNVAMENTEEYKEDTLEHKYGDAFIRGNNGTSCAIFYLILSVLYRTQVIQFMPP